MRNARDHFFPEACAGGFTRVDGTVEFYTRVNALLTPDMVVLDFGAGRGERIVDGSVPFKRELQTLKGKCIRVIGADVDAAVRANPALDEAIVIGADQKLALPDHSVDLIVSDYTFEHLAFPGHAVAELSRVLKPGGWICARTPNRWGYIGLGANLIPNALHTRFLRVLQPARKSVDVFPTAYALNTRRALKTHFPADEFIHIVYGYFPEPAYFGNSRAAWGLAQFSFRFTPEALAPILMVFLRKRAATQASGGNAEH